MPESTTTLYRILDAAGNRAAEGLRVCEDYVRLVLEDRHLTGRLKQLRHNLAEAMQQYPRPLLDASRDIVHDVGTEISAPSEMRRTDARDVCAASFQRVKQALRTLEEYGKVVAPGVAGRFEQLRYELYALECAVGTTQDAVERLAELALCVLIDGGPSDEACLELATRLAAAGVSMIQLREKRLHDDALVRRGRALVQAVRSTTPTTSRPLAIINDRCDVAAAVDADGVHLGQDDMAIRDARRILGPDKLIGRSTHSIEQARAAQLEGANYLGVGPVFASPTKQFAAYPGLALVEQAAAELALPWLAIGGIHLANLAEVQAAGATRVAVRSAIIDADDPAAAAGAVIDALSATPSPWRPPRPLPRPTLPE